MERWVDDALAKLGYRTDGSMRAMQERWKAWFDCTSDFYRQVIDDMATGEDRFRMSLKPARMAADEMATLVMPEDTVIASDDTEMNLWIEERIPDFVDENVEFLSRVFAYGTGVWVLGLRLDGGRVTTEILRYDADEVHLLSGGGCAFSSMATVEGREVRQLQVHTIEDGTARIRTHLYDTDSGRELHFDTVAHDVDTAQPYPTYAIVTPAKANTYSRYSGYGVSIYDDAISTFKMVDEAFNELYWHTRLSRPRVFLDDTMIRRDPKTGAVDYHSTLDKVLFKAVAPSVGSTSPITVYNPETRISDMQQALNSALSIMSVKCGFGQGYFSFDFKQGLKTATEVVANNSQLYRNIKRHEKRIGIAVQDIIQAAYATELSFAGHQVEPGSVPKVDITWDDSVTVDEAKERKEMKDDIARGLCPAWLYPAKYYGMDEKSARRLTEPSDGFGEL